MSPNSQRSNHALDTARQMASLETEKSRKAQRREQRRARLKPKMTWIAALAFILVIAVAGRFINWINLSLVSSNYGKEVQLQQIYLGLEDSFIIVSHDNVHVRLAGQNIDRAMSTLGVSDHRVLRRMPDYNVEDAFYLTLSNGAKFIVAADPAYNGKKDKAFIIYEDHGKSTYLSVEGYNTIFWLEEVSGPVGVYGPNQPVKVGEVIP